jgi:ADP-heptose:LPS heptosyltransferase
MKFEMLSPSQMRILQMTRDPKQTTVPSDHAKTLTKDILDSTRSYLLVQPGAVGAAIRALPDTDLEVLVTELSNITLRHLLAAAQKAAGTADRAGDGRST